MKLFQIANCKLQASDQERYRKLGLMKGAMLFLGLAVENALKGAVVYKSKPDLNKEKLNLSHFHKVPHDLNEVANKLNLHLSSNEKLYLDRLSMFVQWASKYKAPLKQVDFDKSHGQINMQYPSDFDMAKKLISLLQDKSGFCYEKGWPYKS